MLSNPRWRFDILHPIDLVEEIATGIGYESLGEATSTLALEGKPLARSSLVRRINESLSSQGIQQVQSLTLSNDEVQFERMRWKPENAVTRIAGNYYPPYYLASSILPSLLSSSLRINTRTTTSSGMWQVVRGHTNQWRLSWACAEIGTGFTGAKGIAQA